MDANYSNIELTDIVLIYGEALQNSYEAARLYAERFPNRHHPVPRTFLNVVQRLRDTGQVHPRHGAGGGPGQQLRNINRQEEILNIVTENPSSSTRSIARQVELSSSSVWRTLKENHLHPYHTQKVQELTVADYPVRLRFCQWLIQRVEENENFLLLSVHIFVFFNHWNYTEYDFLSTYVKLYRWKLQLAKQCFLLKEDFLIISNISSCLFETIQIWPATKANMMMMYLTIYSMSF